MNTVTSADGTLIAYDRTGSGPSLVFVNGALSTRADVKSVAEVLAPRFTVFAYDRRGRGDSGDTQPYAVEREIQDLEAIVQEAGGQALVFGHSSGAALALEAVVRGLAATRLALYEPPYIVDGSRPPVPVDYVPTLRRLIDEGRAGDAVAYFWQVGILMPPEAIAQMRSAPWFAGIEALGHTLLYDGEVMGDHMRGMPLPQEWATKATLRTLVLDGDQSPASMRNAVEAVVQLLPNAERRTLNGVGHGAPPDVLAPVLEEFFLRA